MSLQDDVAQIKESVRFLPRQFDELRGDIRRLAETFNDELEAEKKRDASLRRLLLSLRQGSPFSKTDGARANQTPAPSLPVRGLLKYLE